jgi:Flp pilus assembly pilin Flp
MTPTSARPPLPRPAAPRASRPAPRAPHDSPPSVRLDETGSLVTEYGLLAVVAATVAGVLIQWATGGAVVNLFNALIDRARELVGA